MRDVAARDGAQTRAFLTGWEAGGHTVWALLLRHPERFAGVVPVSTNFRSRWLPEGSISTAAARKTLPVQVLFCGRDPEIPEVAREGWLAQTREAMALAAAHGFPAIPLVVKDDQRHGPLAADVLAFFTSLLPRP